MFLEKFSRFFRRYDLTFAPRHKGAPHMPLFGEANEYSVADALLSRINTEKALEVQPNGDIIELMKVQYLPAKKALALLFHRASPDAAEPTYRKKARKKAGTTVTIRESTKQEGEEQSVSAHLIIQDVQIKTGVFRAALEEIPGVSMAAMKRVIG